MPGYESEITKFLRDLKDMKPELEDDQIQGRALLWDKEPIDPSELSQSSKVQLKQKPYVYQTD